MSPDFGRTAAGRPAITTRPAESVTGRVQAFKAFSVAAVAVAPSGIASAVILPSELHVAPAACAFGAVESASAVSGVG